MADAMDLAQQREQEDRELPHLQRAQPYRCAISFPL